MPRAFVLAATSLMGLLPVLLFAAEPIDLSEATATSSHADFTGKYPPGDIIDGNAETFWAGDDHDNTQMPTNIVITLPEPMPVGTLQVETQRVKGWVRLTDMEVYVRLTDGWALLGEVRKNGELTFRVDLKPALVSQLRLRVRDTERPDHAWPRISEVQLLAPGNDIELAKLEAATVANETPSERHFLAAALGELPSVPRESYDPARGYLYYARTFADTLLQSGTDATGTVHSPLFHSLLECKTAAHPGVILPPIEGQRQGDRAQFGANLQHDLMLLRALGYLTQTTGDARYADASKQYLSFFLDNCTRTETGLWPWGEHAHWDFVKEAPGHNTHEYLGAAPLDFWEQAWELNPGAVTGEADGLINHVVNLNTFDFNRHADITSPLPDPRPEDAAFLDFPRHGGFYLQVWAFAYSKTGDEKYLKWCDGMMDHHTSVRHAESGLIPITSSQHPNTCGVASQLSLAVTMLEAAPLLGDTDTGKRCAKLANEYLRSLLALPHQPEKGLYCSGAPIAGFPDGADPKLSKPGFSAHYGGEFLAMDALLWAEAYRLTGEQKCLDIARGIAQFYAQADAIPNEGTTRAHIYGSVIELMVDMHDLVGGELWLTAAERFAKQSIEDLYHNGLFRGAANLWYYESQLWPGTLVYSLVRLDAARNHPNVDVPPNYFHR